MNYEEDNLDDLETDLDDAFEEEDTDDDDFDDDDDDDEDDDTFDGYEEWAGDDN